MSILLVLGLTGGAFLVASVLFAACLARLFGRRPPRPEPPGGPGDGRPLSDLEKAVLDGIEAATEASRE